MRRLLAFVFLLFSQVALATTVTTYGTFACLGVHIQIAPTDDPDSDSVNVLQYRKDPSATWLTGFPLSRVKDSGTTTASRNFVGTVFWCDAGTIYDIKVTFSDPDADPLDGVVVLTSGTTRAELVWPNAVHPYYVSTTGNDAWPGSITSPVATVLHAITLVSPGDHIFIRGGTYYESPIEPDGLVLGISGTETSPIIIRGYPGETAIFDGRDGVSYSWTDTGTSGIYTTQINPASSLTRVIMATSGYSTPLSLVRYYSLWDLGHLSYSPWLDPSVTGYSGFYLDSGTTLSVHLLGNADPVSSGVIVAGQSCFWLHRLKYVRFRDLTFRYFWRAVCCEGPSDQCDDIVISSCTFTCCQQVILMSRRGVTQYCTLTNSMYDMPGGWDKHNACKSWGVELTALGCPFRGGVVRYNTISGFMDAMGGGYIDYPGYWDGVTNMTCEMDIYGNAIRHNSDNALGAGGTVINVRMWDNTVESSLDGLSAAVTKIGPLYCLYNLYYDSEKGLPYGGWMHRPYKFGGSGQSGPIYLMHETCATTRSPNGRVGLRFDVGNDHFNPLYIRNSIFDVDVGGESFYVTEGLRNVLDFDYNCYYQNGGNPSHLGKIGLWGGVWWSLAELQANRSLELNGVNVSPSFVNRTGHDYSLSTGSLLIDAGAVIQGINDVGPHAYRGLAPDIGYDEFNSTGGTTPSATISVVPFIITSVLTAGSSGVVQVATAAAINGRLLRVDVTPTSASGTYSVEVLTTTGVDLLNGEGMGIPAIACRLGRRAPWDMPTAAALTVRVSGLAEGESVEVKVYYA